MIVFYFTATGNSLDAARHMGDENSSLFSIPQLMSSGRFDFKGDIVGLVCPVYHFGIPKMVTSFLEKVRWESNYSFAVLTYGGNQSATLYNLQKLAEKHSQHFDYMNLVSTVDNYLPLFEMAEERRKLPDKCVDDRLHDIALDVENRKENTAAATVGQRVMWHIMQAYGTWAARRNTAKKYLVNDSCTNCGVCAMLCPTGNITVTDAVSFGSNCETCLSCAQLCPRNAIHLRTQRSSARYRNANVRLKAIVDANCQEL